MKIFSVALVVALFCAVSVSAAPSSPFINELAEETDVTLYGLNDYIAKIINSLIEKTKCTLDVMEDLLGGGELGTVFLTFKFEIEEILEYEPKKCLETKGFVGKLKCTLGVAYKINKLVLNFMKEVTKANADLAKTVVKSLVKCAGKQSAFISTVETDVSSFGLSDVVTKLLTALLAKAECALDGIEKIIGDGELGSVYKKYRLDIEAIIKDDVKQCVQTKGVVQKLKCTLTITQKINTLNNNFLKEVMKSNKSVGLKITKVLFDCAKKSEKPEEPEKPEKPEKPE